MANIVTMPVHNSQDPELKAIAASLLAGDPSGSRTARVLRETIDQLYNGQRTGHYKWDQLLKTEKTHCGTLVEINLQREFQFRDGEILDYCISEIEVDCKFSQRLNGWMIPPEARGQICMVVWAEDTADPRWSLGLVRTTEERLNTGGNRDSKATLNNIGRDAIHWLWQRSHMPPNVLLQIDPQVVSSMMALTSGAGRVRELFRVTQKRIVGRAVVATVGQQKDYMKRVRANGGARSTLRSEGFLVLGQYLSHVKIATALDLDLPGPGDTISVRVAQTMTPGRGIAEIDGLFWRIATNADPVEMAPILPKPTKREVMEEEG